MVAYEQVTLLFTKCARDVARPCQTTSRSLRAAEDARRAYGAYVRSSLGVGEVKSLELIGSGPVALVSTRKSKHKSEKAPAGAQRSP
jgi:hypothetical protein